MSAQPPLNDRCLAFVQCVLADWRPIYNVGRAAVEQLHDDLVAAHADESDLSAALEGLGEYREGYGFCFCRVFRLGEHTQACVTAHAALLKARGES